VVCGPVDCPPHGDDAFADPRTREALTPVPPSPSLVSARRAPHMAQGCPLRCKWCCNPEGQSYAPEIMHSDAKCQRCGTCAHACPFGAVHVSTDAYTVRVRLPGPARRPVDALSAVAAHNGDPVRWPLAPRRSTVRSASNARRTPASPRARIRRCASQETACPLRRVRWPTPRSRRALVGTHWNGPSALGCCVLCRTAAEVAERLASTQAFTMQGGGATLSGGEALSAPHVPFVRDLAASCAAKGRAIQRRQGRAARGSCAEAGIP